MRDAGRWSELRIPGIAAQTRMVSLARIRLVSRKSPRIFKRIICDDVSEFESHMPSHAVGSLWRVYPVHGLCESQAGSTTAPLGPGLPRDVFLKLNGLCVFERRFELRQVLSFF